MFLSCAALGQSAVSVGRGGASLAGAATPSYYCRTLTFDHTKAGATDSTGFPALVRGTYAYLATVANGGSARSASGYDIAFYTDQTRATKLAWEVESYNAATGDVVYWVQLPTFSHTTDTTVAMCYGDSSLTTNQSNKTGTWSSNFAGVWHLPNGSTLTASDSTSNSNNGTLNSSPTASAGQVDGAASFAGITGAGSPSISVADAASLKPTSITLSAWVKPAASQPQAYPGVIQKAQDSGTTGYGFYLVNATLAPAFLINNSTASSATALSSTAWSHVVGTYDGANIRIYVNAVLKATTAYTTALASNTLPLYFARNNGTAKNFGGGLDEVRVQSTAVSADWITAEYNCGGNTCYTVGTQTAH